MSFSFLINMTARKDEQPFDRVEFDKQRKKPVTENYACVCSSNLSSLYIKIIWTKNHFVYNKKTILLTKKENKVTLKEGTRVIIIFKVFFGVE